MGNLYIVGTPIGNLNDISKRALETLENVDIILCEDTRHSLKLLNYYNIKKKLIAYHKFNEKEKTMSIIQELENGKNIALITDAGMPCISDPGYILVKEASFKQIPILGVGGISAVTTALSISGFDTKSFTFYGFFPRETKYKKEIINYINNSDIKIFVFYESPKRLVNTLQYLKRELENFNITICSDLTKFHEKRYSGSIDVVLEQLVNNPNNELGEYTFIIEKEIKTKQDQEQSLESLLVDIIFTNKLNMKQAIDFLSKNSNYKKSDIYNASLNLKKIFH